MLGKKWYHGTVRKYVIAFGSLFNDIYIDRVDSTGTAVKTIKVPINYGPKERYLARAIQNPDLLRPISLVFPMMAFEITEFRYDSDRKLNTAGRNTTGSTSTGSLSVMRNPVPYNLGFRLSIICRNSDDALRIVEQILPFFTPSLALSIDAVPEMNAGPTDIPLTLDTVNMDETYEGSFEDKEHVIWTLDFTLKAWLYGPINTSKVIKESTINFYMPDGTTITTASIGTSPVQEHIYVRPGLTANGQPTSNVAESVAISQISASDNYGFIVDFVSDVND